MKWPMSAPDSATGRHSIFDLNEEHPPLAKLLAGLPLALRHTYADYNHVSWAVSRSFLPAYMGQWIFGEYILTR